MIYSFFLFFLNIFFFHSVCPSPELAHFNLKNITNEIYKIEYEVKSPYYIIADSLACYTNQQNKINAIKIETEYKGDIISKKNNVSYKVIYKKGNIEIPKKKDIQFININYQLLNTANGEIVNKNITINVPYIKTENQNKIENKIDNKSEIKKPLKKSLIDGFLGILKTKNYILMALIVFCLGFLMSLTPCIYPMIPITISILGIDKQNFQSRLISGLLYMLGMSTIFSILGLLAASGKIMFGSFFQSTIFIIITTIILAIMTLNMLGLLNFYMYWNSTLELPLWIKNSRYLPFFYGMFGGTISSPCVSPGLVALLSLVSQQNNIFIAWLWLFLFGCGLSFPLFLISLVMNSAFIFPQSGSWMNTLKESIGIILCFIVSNNLQLFIGFYSSYAIISIIFIYFIIKKYNTNNYTMQISSFLAILSLFFIAYSSYQEYKNINIMHSHQWENNFNEAQKKAIATKKLLFIDITADWCSICKVVEKKLFRDASFMAQLGERCILCKIDCTKETNENKEITSKYNIKGYPSILLIDPNTFYIKKHYNGDILNEDPQYIIEYIDKIER